WALFGERYALAQEPTAGDEPDQDQSTDPHRPAVVAEEIARVAPVVRARGIVEIGLRTVAAEVRGPGNVGTLLHIAGVEIVHLLVGATGVHHPAGSRAQHGGEGLRSRRQQVGGLLDLIDGDVAIVKALVRRRGARLEALLLAVG